MARLHAQHLLSIVTLATLASAWVELDETIIPGILVPLPVLTLGNPAALPNYALESIIEDIAPGVKLEKNETVGPGLYAYQGDRLVAFVNDTTGESHVFPDLSDINPASQEINPVDAVYRLDLGSSTFPEDDTTSQFVPGASLVGATVEGSDDEDLNTIASTASSTRTYLTHGTMERTINAGGISYPVCGPGSYASFGVAEDGRIHSVSYLWRAATLSGQTITASSRPVVASSIRSQLEPIGLETGLVKVNGVDVCFYDSGVGFIQPVYRFIGTSHANNDTAASEARAVKVIGYVPIGSGSPEAIPATSITSTTDETPDEQALVGRSKARSFLDYFSARSLRARAPVHEVTVGRYLIRDDSKWFTRSAVNTWTSLKSSKIVNFINDQYEWGRQGTYIKNRNTHINSVNIAFTEAHGGWHLFTTEKNCCDVVRMSEIPSPGYGPAASQGSLAYWALHSCEIIPTPLDYTILGDETPVQTALAPWRQIFRGGLHAVLSYRTQMYLQDTVPPRASVWMGQGVPVISAWLRATHNDGVYRGRPTYPSGNYDMDLPFGRGAVVFQCGHESDRVWNVANAGRGTCLRMIWYDNA